MKSKLQLNNFTQQKTENTFVLFISDKSVKMGSEQRILIDADFGPISYVL